jgi:hypothetical protein
MSRALYQPTLTRASEPILSDHNSLIANCFLEKGEDFKTAPAGLAER